MSLLESMKQPGHITEALVHFNQAKEMMTASASKVEVSRCLFDSINKIQTEWVSHENFSDLGEVKAFETMTLKELTREKARNFLESPALRKLVFFTPRIMNHDTLRHNRYKPDVPISLRLEKKASEEHRRLISSYDSYVLNKEPENANRIFERAAELLYIVRSNIAHGEKTSYGPDLKKKERDENVCSATIPLQMLLLNLLLDIPDEKLVAYGTLKPGGKNQQVLSGLIGPWIRCEIAGDLIETNGLPVYRWRPAGDRISAMLLISPGLQERWPEIDKFEGHLYKRQVVTVFVEDRISVANVYVDARQ